MPPTIIQHSHSQCLPIHANLSPLQTRRNRRHALGQRIARWINHLDLGFYAPVPQKRKHQSMVSLQNSTTYAAFPKPHPAPLK